MAQQSSVWSDAAQLADGVAVVTGAAAGLGESLARRCGELQMRVVLVDVDEAGLAAIDDELRSAGVDTIARCADVRDYHELDAVAEEVYSRWGSTSLLFNNAATMVHGATWQTDPDLWDRSVGVGLVGVFHGIRAFVPRMLEQNSPAHVVNIASVGSLRISPFRSSYSAAKHGCLALTECLALELAEVGAPIGVSAAIPGSLRTSIARSATLVDDDGAAERLHAQFAANIEVGMDPDAAAAIVIQGVLSGTLRIHTDPAMSREFIEDRHANLIADAGPSRSNGGDA